MVERLGEGLVVGELRKFLVDLLDNVDFCLFQENQILFLVFVGVLSEGLVSEVVLLGSAKGLPLPQFEQVLAVIGEGLDEFEDVLEEE